MSWGAYSVQPDNSTPFMLHDEAPRLLGKQPQPSTGNEPAGLLRFKGVRLRRWGKWVAEVRLPRSREKIWLGSYATAEEAARAYDAAMYCLKGPGAALNFPDHPPDISSADKLSRPEIRTAARKHARNGPKRVDDARPAGASEVEGVATAMNPGKGSSGLRATGQLSQGSSPEFCLMAEEWGFNVQSGTGDCGGDDYGDIYKNSPLWNF